nr:15252_t:CDS:2 [Entrophospora candida]
MLIKKEVEASKNKRIIRYHQYACLQEALKVVSQRKIKEGVVAHTTGSGKSDTMVFLAKKLRQEYQQCTIIVITDRQELDLQLLDRFQDYEDVFFAPKEFIIITSIKNLGENLAKPNLGKIIFVLIQKFQIRELQALPTFSNSKGLFIFIDEYHRSQNLEIGEGDSLKETYQNIIHSYLMDDALQDEVIVRIVYEIYQYLDLNKIKKNPFRPKSVLPSLQVKGEFFKKDYENFSLNNQLKGQKPKVMYIAQSIPAARELYQYLSQDPQFQNNICLITSAQEEKEEKTSIHQFKNTPDINITIVVDKLTTGFNLESLQRIYLDQKINSPHPDNQEVLEETLAKYVGRSGGGGEKPKDGSGVQIENFDFTQVEIFIIPDHQINPSQTPFVYKNQQEEKIRQMISEREDCGLLKLNEYLTELAKSLSKSNEEIKQEMAKNIHYPLTRQIIQELPIKKRREGRKEINEYAEKFFDEGLSQEKRESIIRIIENYFSTINRQFEQQKTKISPKHQEDSDYYELWLEKETSSGRTGGEFYTPAQLVQLLVNILQPFPQTDYEVVIYDPCCGSGGMFIQSQEFITKNKKGNNVYPPLCLGQEIDDST